MVLRKQSVRPIGSKEGNRKCSENLEASIHLHWEDWKELTKMITFEQVIKVSKYLPAVGFLEVEDEGEDCGMMEWCGQKG